MRNLGVTCLRYSAQTYAYSLLVTGRYPSAAPVLRQREPARAGSGARRRPVRAGSRGHVLRSAGSRLRRSRRSRSARSSSTPPPSPTTSRFRTSTSTRSSAPTSSRARSATSASSTSTGSSPQIALLVTLWIYAKRGAGLARESSAGPIGTGMLLGMLGLAIAWLVHVPFALAAHWWQRRWDQNDLSYVDWLFEDWAVLAAQFLSVCIALLIVMGLARRLGDRWWLPGAAVFVGIAALFSFVAPVPRTTRRRRSRTSRCSRPRARTRRSSASGTSRSASRR